MKRFFSIFISICIFMSLIPYAIAEEDYGENLCLGKYVFSNGYYSEGYKAWKAVDGNYYTQAVCGPNEKNPLPGLQDYFAVDLGEEYSINRIIVRTRRDVQDKWGRVIEAVGTANKADLSDFIKFGEKTNGGEMGSDLNVKLDKPQRARYIVVNANCGLADIEAYGEPYVEVAEGEFSDVSSNDKYARAVRMVTKLKIMEGVDDGEFGAVNLLTRAEAASIAIKILGVKPGKYGDEYKDVSSDTKYAPDISAALQSGVVLAADYFRPDDYVTLCEFYTMMLRINRYINKFVDVEWTNTVLKLARESGLSKGIAEKTDVVNRSDAALIIYNLLTSKYIDIKMKSTNYVYTVSDNTYLHDKYKMDIIEGIVTADNASALEAEDGRVNSAVKVGEKIYNYDTKNDKFLGKAVYCLVNYEDEELVDIQVNEKQNETLELFAEDISNTSKTEIVVCDKTGKNKKYRIGKDAYFLKNGVAYSDIDYNDMIPKYGSVVLTDYNRDGVYDVVELREPEITVISLASFDEEQNELIISGKDNYKRTINFDTARVYNNGMSGNLSTIKKDSLAYIYLTDSGKHLEIELFKKKVSGVVTKVNNDKINVDGTEYEVSEYFADNFVKNITINKEYDFLLNERNQIVYVIDTNEFSNTEQIVYIRNCVANEDDDIIEFDFYTEENKFIKLKTSDKFKLDGEKLSKEGFEALGKLYFAGHPAIISTNSQGELIRMTTDNSEKLSMRNINIIGTRKAVAGFYDGHMLVLPTCYDTIVFSVPTNSQGLPQTASNFNNLYSVTTMDIKYPKYRNQVGTNCTLYGYDKNDLPIVGIVPTVYNEVTGFAPISNYEGLSSLIVSKVYQTLDSDDELVYGIEGYDIIKGAKRTLTTYPGLDTAVNSFKIQNQSLYDDVPDDKKPQADWVEATQILKGNKINEYYITPIENIQKNDIIRFASYEGMDAISELEVVLEYEKFKNIQNTVLYSVGDLPGTIFSTFRLEKVLIGSCSGERIKYYTNDVDEDLRLSDFKGNLIVIDNMANVYSPVKAEGYVNKNMNAIVFSSAGEHYSIIMYR